MTDILTVVRKEWRELVLSAGGLRGGRMGFAVIFFVFGVMLPLSMGVMWVRLPLILFAWLWLSFFMVMMVITDSIAGERERHTLETLLASRLPDDAILYGKFATGVLYGFSLALANAALGLILLNLTRRGGGPIMFGPVMALGVAGFSLLGAALAAGLGVIVSLKAATVRQAQQGLMGIVIVLSLAPTVGLQALPNAWKMGLFNGMMRPEAPRLIVFPGLAFLLILDLALLALARSRFRRSRLILY